MHVSLNNDDIMCALFLDSSKAFDSLDQAILIRKLSNSVSWFETLGQFIKHVYYQYADYRKLIDN